MDWKPEELADGHALLFRDWLACNAFQYIEMDLGDSMSCGVGACSI